MRDSTIRAPRASGTRAVILAVAERMYAEQGVVAVSNRQISEASRQGNNTAVGYHFGTKRDLIRAIVVEHTTPIDEIRQTLLHAAPAPMSLRDWLSCLVFPLTSHLTELGEATWYARFSAQVLADPALHPIMSDVTSASVPMQETLAGIRRCIPELPVSVRKSRGEMARTLLIHGTAEHERAVALAGTDRADSWEDVGIDLVDALIGLWHAPTSRYEHL